MPGLVPGLGGLLLRLFSPKVWQFVVIVVGVVVGVIVFVGVVGGNIIITFPVVDRGPATAAAGTGLSFCKHRGMVAVLVGA